MLGWKKRSGVLAKRRKRLPLTRTKQFSAYGLLVGSARCGESRLPSGVKHKRGFSTAKMVVVVCPACFILRNKKCPLSMNFVMRGSVHTTRRLLFLQKRSLMPKHGPVTTKRCRKSIDSLLKFAILKQMAIWFPPNSRCPTKTTNARLHSAVGSVVSIWKTTSAEVLSSV